MVYTTEEARRRLREISKSYEDRAEERKSDGSVRHKCFISYHAEDAVAVLEFVTSFESVIIPKIVGVTDDEPWIESDDDAYVLRRIQENYLRDSTVTIVMNGACTWSRKFIDWEVYSSLRQTSARGVNGLLAIELPTAGALPARVALNVKRNKDGDDVGYARYFVYPSTTTALQRWVQDAFDARSTRSELIELGGTRRRNNLKCP